MYCTNCGHKNPEGANFCSSCGSPLQEGRDDTTITFMPGELEADPAGLDAMDRRYLSTIAVNYGGGPVGVGTATAKSMVLNIVLVHLIGMLGTQIFWGANPRAPIGG